MDEFAMPPPAPDETEISLDDSAGTTSSPQKEATAHSGESAKEQSTVKPETTDFVFSTMKSSLVRVFLLAVLNWLMVYSH